MSGTNAETHTSHAHRKTILMRRFIAFFTLATSCDTGKVSVLSADSLRMAATEESVVESRDCSHRTSHHKFIHCIKYLFESFNSCHRVVQPFIVERKIVLAHIGGAICFGTETIPASKSQRAVKCTKQTTPSLVIHQNQYTGSSHHFGSMSL